MLSKDDLDQIRQVVREEAHYSYDERAVSLVGISRDIHKVLEGLVSALTQGDNIQEKLKKILESLKHQG